MIERVREQVEQWRRELINLARGNRLLYFRHTKTSTLEIEEPGAPVVLDGLGPSGGKGWDFYSPPEVEDEEGESPPPPPRRPNELLTSKADAKGLLTALRSLERRTSQEFMDKGLWVLYLGVGMLEWIDPADDEIAHSPILLIPVTLHRDTPREPFRLHRAEEDPLINPALIVKLESEFGLQLPGFDDLEDVAPETVFKAVEPLVAENGWRVLPRLVISTFSFHKEVMYRDLLANENKICGHPIVQALALGSQAEADFDFEPIPEEDLDEKAPIEQSETILDADASQRQCIAAACDGHSFVMDGPPGTGKSQTITNVIAELLEQGKRVLFVSEKAAALEVVHERLKAAGLAPFVLELHSHKARRRELAQELGRALARQPRVPPALESTDVSRLIARRKRLSAYAAAINEVRQPLGRSLHQVLGRVVQLQDLPQAPGPNVLGLDLSAESLASLLDTASGLGRAWGPVERGEEFLWRELRDADLSAARKGEIASQIEEAMQALEKLQGITVATADGARLPWKFGPQDSQRLIAVLEHLQEGPSVITSWLTQDSLLAVSQRIEELSAKCAWHKDCAALLEQNVGQNWRELKPGDLTKLRTASERIARAEPFWTVPAPLVRERLTALRDLIAQSLTRLPQAREDASLLSNHLGLPTDGLSPLRALEVAELGCLLGATAPPEANWLDPAAVSAVRIGASVLEHLVSDYRRRRDELSKVFTEEVLQLDLESIAVRFESVHKGFGRLRKAYREDKRALVGCTRSRKVNKSTLASLGEALEWQRVSRSLEEAEQRHAQVLGSYYYRNVDTDFTALTSAIEVAQRALELVAHELNRERLVGTLARGAHPDPTLLPVARRLRDSLSEWGAQVADLLEEHAQTLMSTSLTSCVNWCSSVLDSVEVLEEVVARVSEIAGRALTVGQAGELLEWRREVDLVERELTDARAAERDLLGLGYVGLETDWDALRRSFEWTEQLREILEGAVSTGTAERLLTGDYSPAPIRDSLIDWEKQRDAVSDYFSDARQQDVALDLSATFVESQRLLSDLHRSLGDIEEWARFTRLRTELDEAGLKAAVDFCAERRVSADVLSDSIERCILERWVEEVIKADRQRLEPLRAEDRDQYVDEFRALDRALIDQARGRVIQACNKRRPRTRVGAAGIVEREANKKRKHMPIRRLLEETALVAQALKPCFMMSPLTVSQFLSPTMRFDAVIFDEASQVRPSDAVNCVYRGDQLIVAGDQKQLPPTSFFEKVSLDEDDEYEEEQFEEFESILDLCKGAGAFRSLPLRWHYRSQYEDLITYSNYSFYDGRLITFPGAFHEASDLGLELTRVQGVYRRGGPRDNPLEAEAVAERVLHHARHHPQHTLGVVAFSEAQAAAIEIEIEKKRQVNPELDFYFGDDRLHGFFVKNLESVQGDERDIIIFSVGYGPDEAGRFTLQFGPLNKMGGHRRLNVAISRARRRVEVLASVSAADFHGESMSEGVRHLKRYLDFLERGRAALALDLDESDRDVESPFEAEVAQTIRSWGYEVVPQVGAADYRIDLGVRDPSRPGRFVLGVECDGAMYHSSKVARDRDRLRQEVLEGLDWKLHRIWGTAWYRDREGQEVRLRTAIETATNEAGQTATPKRREREQPTEIDFEDVALDHAPSWTEPYRTASPGAPRWRIDMHDPSARLDLKRMIKETVEVESPASEEVVLRRVREAWGVGRAGARIRQAFTDALMSLVREGRVKRDRYGFLWIAELVKVRVPVEGTPSTRREVEEVPQEEVQLAIRHLVRDAHSISWDELTTAVARLFGWSRRGPDIAVTLDDAVEALVDREMISLNGDRLESLNGD